MSKTGRSDNGNSKKEDDLQFFQKVRAIALEAVAEIKEYCNDPEAYVQKYECALKVSLDEYHPVALKAEEWYYHAHFGICIEEATRSSLEEDRVLKLWDDFCLCSDDPSGIIRLKLAGRALVEYLESMYKPSTQGHESDSVSTDDSSELSMAEQEAQPNPTEQQEEPKATKAPPCLKLHPESRTVEVKGKFKQLRRESHYKLVKALHDAYPKRLSKDELNHVSGLQDARKVLGRWVNDDPDWAAVISMASESWGSYGIVCEQADTDGIH